MRTIVWHVKYFILIVETKELFPSTEPNWQIGLGELAVV